MNSIIFNNENITPTNASQNNVTITVTADAQELYINNVAPKTRTDVLSVDTYVDSFSGNIEFVNTDGETLGTVRITNESILGQEINFDYATDAPISIIFYGQDPYAVYANYTAYTLDHSAQDESEDTTDDGSGSLANETVRYYYVIPQSGLQTGKNIIAIITDEAALSGIKGVIADEQSNDVYNLQGIRVLHNANNAQMRQLPAGLYIVNGKKMIIK